METMTPDTGRMIEKELFIRATPARVFRALTEKADLEAWFVKEATIDLRVGGALRLFWDPESVEGTFLEIDPPRRVVFTWDERPAIAGITTSAFTLTAEERRHAAPSRPFRLRQRRGMEPPLREHQRWLERGVGKPAPLSRRGRCKILAG